MKIREALTFDDVLLQPAHSAVLPAEVVFPPRLGANYGQKLFVAKIDDDLIGIATVRVGLGTTGTFVGVANSLRSSSTLFFNISAVTDDEYLKLNKTSTFPGTTFVAPVPPLIFET